ncbi:hypothetical protein OVA24_15545 [Luteolibacter sp. SL250]|uniref:hypothetical protein n=1 Tax=Luteolibacter sp. SL250 TaxID=2995170 RepID=UPI002271A840|nr:hypothetical protein [Luteolibacter sp. SL250]WAC18646.1 hypothetical protein OVA24_15545 [Luteolibacter sp. SL250]
MSREYYDCLFRFRGAERHLIWFSDDRDGVFADEHYKVPTFASTESLESAFPRLVHGQLKIESPILQDLDSVEASCRSSGKLEIDCGSFLTAWNLYVDVARSVGDRGSAYLDSDSSLDAEYDKLFHGNNFPAMTPPGQHYIPSWSDSERDNIRKHLILGSELFGESIFRHELIGGLE